MQINQIPDRVSRFSAGSAKSVSGMVSRREISRRTLEQARHGAGSKTLHSAAALVLLLHDALSADRTIEFQSHARIVMLTQSDFLAMTTHQAN